MTTTVKRISISLTKEEQRQLMALCEWCGENKSQVIHRAICLLYQAEKDFQDSQKGSDK